MSDPKQASAMKFKIMRKYKFIFQVCLFPSCFPHGTLGIVLYKLGLRLSGWPKPAVGSQAKPGFL